MPMSRDGVPVYVRATTRAGTTTRRPQYVHETDLSTSPAGCPIYSSTSPPRKVICQQISNINETHLWCEECRASREYTHLKKSYQAQGVRMATVWQDTDTINLSTGRVESDPKKFAAHLRQKSEEMSERLGMKVDYQPCDMTDKDALGVTDEGLDATHDHQVRTGQKDSRGRFVF